MNPASDRSTQPSKQRILLAMSGGIDSSVAACLLQEQGFEVIGVFMHMGAAKFLPETPESGEDAKGCGSPKDAGDAQRIADKLGIPLVVLDFSEDFSRLIEYFVDEYAAARTPNPCVLCNQRLKFGKLAEYADTIGAGLIATGHYARVDVVDGRPRLRRGLSLEKDQSYVLFGVEPATLLRTRFPLGELAKDEVRAQAAKRGLDLHDKPESQDICFVPDGDYGRLVRDRRSEACRPGPIRHVDGRVLGEHEGLPYFTIGQRRGLRVAVGTPLYVCRLDAATNALIVGPRESLFASEARAWGVRWLAGDAPGAAFRAEVKIRYLHAAAAAEVAVMAKDRVAVRFDEPQPAITPGQALVIYEGDEVLGGGWIE